MTTRSTKNNRSKIWMEKNSLGALVTCTKRLLP